MRLARTGGTRIPVSSARPDLATELAAAVEGDVRFDTGTRAVYSTDASNYRQVPIGVVTPRTIDDVVTAVGICRQHDVPVLSRGGGTSLAGQCCNTAVVLDFSRHLDQILHIDPDRRTARVQPGVVLDDLQAAARPHGLRFGPDPSTHNRCTFGGMIGNNACGVHSVMAGRTSDNVESLEVLTYDGARFSTGADEDEADAIVAAGGRRGEIYAALRQLRDEVGPLVRERYPDIPRRVSGYNLDDLLPEHGFHVARALVGSEATCVTVLEAEVRLVPDPAHKSLLVLGYPDLVAAAEHVPEIMEHGPIGLEAMDHRVFTRTTDQGPRTGAAALLPEADAWLLVELGSETAAETDDRSRRLMRDLGGDAAAPAMALFDDPVEARMVWEARESGLGATAIEPDGTRTWPGWEDSAVPPDRLADYLRDLLDLYEEHGFTTSLYGHFGQGCVHSRINFDLATAPGVARFRSFLDDAAELVVRYGGSLSGEHGDGQARGELLETMFGPELVDAFRRFKEIWDPKGRMNPGKVVDARPITEDLRVGTSHHPRHTPTVFGYPDSDGSFAEATDRCVGVGKCRKTGSGTMCPSYMVTRDEEHSTRGRARALFEMVRGETITDGWRSKDVLRTLDLCLACKACANECPVNVDMATYKAEFLHQHYRRRVRPRAHYAMGLLPIWARMAARAPGLVNRLTQSRKLGAVLQRAAGLTTDLQVPAFSPQPLRRALADRIPTKRSPGPGGGTDRVEVVLWPDTFTSYFDPDVGVAAVEVLEAAGLRPVLPPGRVCCGLPMISTGMLGPARRVLRRALDTLRPFLEAGTRVVVLEPSCAAVFRHDLGELFAGDLDATRLAAQTVTLGELLAETDWSGPDLAGTNALVQPHCHHRAVMGLDADRSVMEQAGLQAEVLDAGCCGLAGNFGFEAGHEAVSAGAAERVLLPRVREAPEALIMADGFSCRTQISQRTERAPLHLAQVLAGRGERPRA